MVDTSRLKEEYAALKSQLEKTNEEISRQELKIALNKREKSYEKAVSGKSVEHSDISNKDTSRSSVISTKR